MTRPRAYLDLHEHLALLEKAGLLLTVDRPIDKDSQMHPLVRWQYVGGIEEKDRKAFLFNHVVDGRGRHYPFPVVVGALAASAAVYCLGMQTSAENMQKKWDEATAHPIAPVVVGQGVCQEVVIQGEALCGEGNGLDRLPIPISTPGFDSAPTLTATNVITKDPDSGIHNHGTYRAALKATDRLVIRMATRTGGAGGYRHYLKHQKRGDLKMPCAIVLGAPPLVAYVAPMKLPVDVDEMGVAGALAGGPIHLVKALTVDLLVPAEAEIVIEGYLDTQHLEPEGPFGESHGHVALEEYNIPMHVTASTHRKNAVIVSYLSQVTPSESSAIKRVSYEPMFLAHLRQSLGIRSVKRVKLHERLTALRRIIIIVMENNAPRTEIWRALQGASAFRADCGKFCIAVNEDIDPENSDAIFWAMAFRMNPAEDLQVIRYRSPGHGPEREHEAEREDATLLMDATKKEQLPPLALPKEQYMVEAGKIWDELGLPSRHAQSPWFSSGEGQWSERWEAAAQRAVNGQYLENGKNSQLFLKKGIKPETRFEPPVLGDGDLSLK